MSEDCGECEFNSKFNCFYLLKPSLIVLGTLLFMTQVVRTANDVLQSVAAQRGIQRSPGPLEYIQINSQDQNTLFNTCVSTLQTAISAMQPHITSHIAKFDEFSLLWKTDLQQTYQDFINTSPTLEDIEYQLQKLVKTEQSLEAVCQDFSIGAALRLNSKPIWHALHALASNWKAQFSSNLHDKALTDLQVRVSHSLITYYSNQPLSTVTIC